MIKNMLLLIASFLLLAPAFVQAGRDERRLLPNPASYLELGTAYNATFFDAICAEKKYSWFESYGGTGEVTRDE
jgi:hypothetical protein